MFALSSNIREKATRSQRAEWSLCRKPQHVECESFNWKPKKKSFPSQTLSQTMGKVGSETWAQHQTFEHTFAIQLIVEHLNTLSLRTVWSYIWNLPYRKWIHWDEGGIGPRVITGRPPGVPLSMINHLDRHLEPSQVNLLKCSFAPTKINDWIMTLGQLFGDILISFRKDGVWAREVCSSQWSVTWTGNWNPPTGEPSSLYLKVASCILPVFCLQTLTLNNRGKQF